MSAEELFFSLLEIWKGERMKLAVYTQDGVPVVCSYAVQPAESNKQNQQEYCSIEIMEWKSEDPAIGQEGLVMDQVT